MTTKKLARRHFIQFLAASPLFAGLGPDAVCIGRAYLWGLAAFGQPGVEKVLDILRAELALVMGQMGTPSLKDIGPHSIARH